jgi:hypothetical protein
MRTGAGGIVIAPAGTAETGVDLKVETGSMPFMGKPNPHRITQRLIQCEI